MTPNDPQVREVVARAMEPYIEEFHTDFDGAADAVLAALRGIGWGPTEPLRKAFCRIGVQALRIEMTTSMAEAREAAVMISDDASAALRAAGEGT